jgi:hypothetical protein
LHGFFDSSSGDTFLSTTLSTAEEWTVTTQVQLDAGTSRERSERKKS